MSDLTKKHVLLVTGASSEVGVAIIKSIYKDYKKIYLQFRTMNPKLAELISTMVNDGVDVTAIQADLLVDNDIDTMIKEITDSSVIPDTILHLPSPKLKQTHFKKENIEDFDEGYRVGVRSAVKVCQAFAPIMAKNKYGRIVFMLSDVTLNMPPKFEASYVTTKYALLGLMKSLSVEYADKGVTVNAVSPDMMETKLLSLLPEKMLELNKDNSPLDRNINVEEVVPVVKLFLSDGSEAITGQNMGITGGM